MDTLGPSCVWRCIPRRQASNLDNRCKSCEPFGGAFRPRGRRRNLAFSSSHKRIYRLHLAIERHTSFTCNPPRSVIVGIVSPGETRARKRGELTRWRTRRPRVFGFQLSKSMSGRCNKRAKHTAPSVWLKMKLSNRGNHPCDARRGGLAPRNLANHLCSTTWDVVPVPGGA